MTSIDFLNKVHKILDSQEYNLSYSPAKSKNYMLYCNGNFIGGLFDEELCFVYADSVSELLGHPEPVYRGYSSTAQHRMLVIPEEHWSKALKLLYAEKFDWSRLVYDITYTSIGAAVVEDFYDENVVCALPGFVDSKNEEKTERNAGYLVVSHSGGGMLRQGTRKGIRRTPANRGMRAHWVVKGLDISEDVCHGMCP